MADKPQLTDHLDLGPGLVVTPGYEVAPAPSVNGPTFSDRVLTVSHDDEAIRRAAQKFVTQNVADVPILSTFEGKASGLNLKADVPAEVQPAPEVAPVPAPTEPVQG